MLQANLPLCLAFDLHSSSCSLSCSAFYPSHPFSSSFCSVSFILSQSYRTVYCVCLQALSIICVGCYSEIVIRLTISPEDFKQLINPHGFTHTFRDPLPEVTRIDAGRMYGQMMAQYNGLTAYVWVLTILFVAYITDKPVHPHVVSNMLLYP